MMQEELRKPCGIRQDPQKKQEIRDTPYVKLNGGCVLT
jgi:hypothetical protein